MTEYHTRPAEEADLPRINAIWYQNEAADGDDPPPPGPQLAGYPHLMQYGSLRVALDKCGAINGFGAAMTWRTQRGPLTYLSDLFIDTGAQSHGAGQALMAALLPGDSARCVMASKDARATALYIRWGMLPMWPNYWLAAESRALGCKISGLPGADIAVEPVETDDAELARWDAELCGFERQNDLRWMADAREATPFWLTRNGERLGYAYFQRQVDESLWRPEAWMVGPVGARDARDAAACVGAAIRYAAGRAPALRLGIPGPHPALPSLIEAGFRIVYIETFLASEGATPFDPSRYLPGGIFL